MTLPIELDPEEKGNSMSREAMMLHHWPVGEKLRCIESASYRLPTDRSFTVKESGPGHVSFIQSEIPAGAYRGPYSPACFVLWTDEPAVDTDLVNHPPHYTAHPSGVECITVTEHMNFCRGNAVKYIWRAGDKGSEIEDLKKARWYIDREISRLMANDESAKTPMNAGVSA